jgi:serine/threonine-protein kinase RIO1
LQSTANTIRPLKRLRDQDDDDSEASTTAAADDKSLAPLSADDPASDREKMPQYKSKVRVLERYQIIGFISSGTYGRVYKARSRTPGNKKEFAIKKFVFSILAPKQCLTEV